MDHQQWQAAVKEEPVEEEIEDYSSAIMVSQGAAYIYSHRETDIEPTDSRLIHMAPMPVGCVDRKFMHLGQGNNQLLSVREDLDDWHLLKEQPSKDDVFFYCLRRVPLSRAEQRINWRDSEWYFALLNNDQRIVLDYLERKQLLTRLETDDQNQWLYLKITCRPDSQCTRQYLRVLCEKVFRRCNSIMGVSYWPYERRDIRLPSREHRLRLDLLQPEQRTRAVFDVCHNYPIPSRARGLWSEGGVSVEGKGLMRDFRLLTGQWYSQKYPEQKQAVITELGDNPTALQETKELREQNSRREGEPYHVYLNFII